ncbi:MAG: response regulator transcription factor [Candidatus Obscuribacterales bacterium]|nr:response regulator transcription factor [Candidatus Obscuribacterales bacterium]
MAKILIVEDDKSIANTLIDLLKHEQHTVEAVHSGTDGLDRLKFYAYDLVVLDWELPGMTGVDLLRTFRNSGGTSQVLMLTGKSEMDSKEYGLDCGADDYLTKPFDIREFLARIRSLLRRPSSYVPVRQTQSYGLDPKTFNLIRDGVEIKLLPKEFALMEFLMRHPQQFFSPDQILNHVWPNESDASVEALRTCIKRLRQKIDKADEPSVIQSSRGCGYKFEPPSADKPAPTVISEQ